MERATQKDERGYYLVGDGIYSDEGTPEKFRGDDVDRLAAYEDTGLTPEQCENAKVIIESAFSDDTSKAERIRELLNAYKAGRVVVLPCKVGDVVYGFHVEKTILPMVAKWIETNTDGWCIAVQYTPMAPRFYRFSDFGKTVFLTREEAEKALEARKDGDKTDL